MPQAENKAEYELVPYLLFPVSARTDTLNS